VEFSYREQRADAFLRAPPPSFPRLLGVRLGFAQTLHVRRELRLLPEDEINVALILFPPLGLLSLSSLQFVVFLTHAITVLSVRSFLVSSRLSMTPAPSECEGAGVVSADYLHGFARRQRESSVPT
jgi:hypothetical protein